jgi:hypothetical protein
MEVLILMVLFLYIFSVISVNYFKGYLYNCSTEGLDPYQVHLSPLHDIVQTKWDCLNAGADWKNRFLNFDNVPQAMATLFVISNSVQWGEIMYQISASRNIDMVSKQGEINSIMSAIFFVIIVILGNFFVMNLYIGVIISKYNREKDL